MAIGGSYEVLARVGNILLANTVARKQIYNRPQGKLLTSAEADFKHKSSAPFIIRGSKNRQDLILCIAF